MATKIFSYFEKYGYIFLISFVLCISFCNAFATDVDIRSISFKENRPASHDNLENSIMDRDETMQVLMQNISTIVSVNPNKFRFKIVGFTDNQECKGTECSVLSLRRAKCVNEWLLSHGASAEQLLPPEGHGSNDPLNDNGSPIERESNRRVEFQIVPFP